MALGTEFYADGTPPQICAADAAQSSMEPCCAFGEEKFAEIVGPFETNVSMYTPFRQFNIPSRDFGDAAHGGNDTLGCAAAVMDAAEEMSRGPAFYCNNDGWPNKTDGGVGVARHTISMAAYLMGAAEGSYFSSGLHWSDLIPGTHDKAWPFWPDFKKKLGKPLGPMVRSGMVFTREFEGLSARIDCGKMEASLDWKSDGVQSSPKPLKADDACTTWYDTTTHGSAFRSVKEFGAKGDGKTDDTRAIQAAVDHDRGNVEAKRPAVVYFPPGRYVVSDTIVAWFYTHLVGSFKCNSTLVLKEKSPGYAVPRSPRPAAGAAFWVKPVVAFSSGFNVKLSSHAWWPSAGRFNASWCVPEAAVKGGRCGDAFNMNFFAEMRNLNVEVGAGNPGASGVLWNVAQQTVIRNVSLDLSESGYVGLDLGGDSDLLAVHEFGEGDGHGGGGTIEDVEIYGGSIGMRASGSQWTFRSIHIHGAKDMGLRLGSTWAFAILDLQVINSPLGVSMQGNQATLFVDCAFEIKGASESPTAALVGDAATQVYLERVTQRGAAQLFTGPHGSVTALEAGSSFYVGRAFGDGRVLATSGSRPIPAWRRRTPLRGRPSFEVEAAAVVVNAFDEGCKGDWVTDDTACLQSAVDKAAKGLLFLPFGNFRVSSTIHLHPHTKIMGEGLSRIILADNASSFDDPTRTKPIVATPDDAAGSVVLADVRITSGAGNVGAVLLDWAVGEASGLFDVHLTVGSGNEGAGGLGMQDAGEVSTLFHLHGHGGGVFANVHGWGADHNVSNDAGLPDGHATYGVMASSTGPAYFLGCAFEHHKASAFNLTDASNYTFYAFQTEQTNQALLFNRTDAVLVYGTVITYSGALSTGDSLAFVDSSSTRTEIYGLNTLMKRQPKPIPMWEMLTVEGAPNRSVPRVAPSGVGSGNWGGRCHSGDCAMVVVLQ